MPSALAALYAAALLSTVAADCSYVSLYTAEPDETLPHVNEQGSRVPVTWSVTGSRGMQNSVALQWASVPTGTYTYVGLWGDPSSTSTTYFRGWLLIPNGGVTLPITGPLMLPIGALTIGLP